MKLRTDIKAIEAWVVKEKKEQSKAACLKD